MTIYGYARISTKTQNIDRQIRNIRQAHPDAKIFEEAFTGTKIERPQLQKMLKRLQAGDTVVFDSVSRMSRNADDGYQLYQELADKGIKLEFLKEPQINTETYQKGLLVEFPETDSEIIKPILEGVRKALQAVQREQIRQAFEQAEKEVKDLHDRTKEGIQTARLNGKKIGRPEGKKETQKSKDAKALILKHSKSFGGTLLDEEMQKVAGISRNSLYKYKRELKGEE